MSDIKFSQEISRRYRSDQEFRSYLTKIICEMSRGFKIEYTQDDIICRINKDKNVWTISFRYELESHNKKENFFYNDPCISYLRKLTKNQLIDCLVDVLRTDNLGNSCESPITVKYAKERLAAILSYRENQIHYCICNHCGEQNSESQSTCISCGYYL